MLRTLLKLITIVVCFVFAIGLFEISYLHSPAQHHSESELTEEEEAIHEPPLMLRETSFQRLFSVSTCLPDNPFSAVLLKPPQLSSIA